LDDKIYKVEKINTQALKDYLDGVGYSAKILYEEPEKGTNSFSPQNKLIFATGPLTSYRVPGGGSTEVCFKSPLTMAWGESRCGGNFGPDFKKAGYDSLIIEGKTTKPIYLLIDDNRIKFKDASHLLGKTVSEKTKIMRKELDDKNISVMCFGIAGENLVKYATVMFEGRVASRCGAGAVMGSKNLIAIAAKGSHKTPIAQPEKLTETIKTCLKILKENDFATNLKKHDTTNSLIST
jgi:aldehyde:ferredoxin oxidoreductase